MIEPVEFMLNRKPVKLTVDGERKLLWVLRTDLGLTGTKYGCGEGICGACTVVVDGKAHRSCQMPVRDVRGKEVLTIEGLAPNGTLHPLQKAFLERGVPVRLLHLGHDHERLRAASCESAAFERRYRPGDG